MILKPNVNNLLDEEVGLAPVPEPRSELFHKKYGSIPAWRDSFLDPNEPYNIVAATSESNGGGGGDILKQDKELQSFIVKKHLPTTGNGGTLKKGEEERQSSNFAKKKFTNAKEKIRISFRESFKAIKNASQKRCSIIDHTGTATMQSEIINLVNNIIGSGIVALPSGIAAFGDAPSALIPAIGIIWLIGTMNTYYFSLIGRLCGMTGCSTYRETWDKTVGDFAPWSDVVAVFCTGKPLLSLLCLSIILADSCHSLFLTAGFDEWTRTEILILVTVTCLIPLCLIKNMNILAPFSFAGILAIIFTAFVMAVRYFDGSYALPDGKYLKDVSDDFKPSFGTMGATGVLRMQSMVLVCMLSTAYVTHYNSPRFYMELKDNTVQRYTYMAAISFSICAIIFMAVAGFGFLTFGANSAGFVLNNYAESDALAASSRLALSLSAIFTYPVLFIGVRDNMVDLLKIPVEVQTAGNLNIISIFTLAFITILACYCHDLGFIVSIGGATLATAIIFVFPVLMFRAVVRNLAYEATSAQKRELLVSLMMMIVGVLIGFIGIWFSMLNID